MGLLELVAKLGRSMLRPYRRLTYTRGLLKVPSARWCGRLRPRWREEQESKYGWRRKFGNGITLRGSFARGRSTGTRPLTYWKIRRGGLRIRRILNLGAKN